MDTNPYRPPISTNKGALPTDNGAWRDGDYLVVRAKRHLLADRCVICNEPAEGRRTRIKVRRFSGSWPLILIFRPWIYLFFRGLAPSAKVRVGLCRHHMWRKRLGFAGVFFGYYASRLLTAVKIDRGFVWIAGVSPEFLSDVPQIPDRSETSAVSPSEGN